MRCHTGPGKVKVLTPAAANGASALSAVLYNFDIDDATVKPEHQRWLDSQVVPRLKADARAAVALRGSSSRSGDAAYDRVLSKRRVDAVRTYLVGAGVHAVQISTTFTGKDLSTSPNVEDAADRAVFVLLSAAPSKTPTFEHALPRRRYDGFEKPVRRVTGSPGVAFGIPVRGNVTAADAPDVPRIEASQIVPLGPVPFAKVRVLNARGMHITSLEPAVARVSPADKTNDAFLGSNDETVLVQGLTRGNATLVVIPLGSGPRVASLEVTTLPQRVVKARFHFVEPRKLGSATEKPVLIGTRRTDGDELKLLDGVNKVYGPQTNIRFEPVLPRLRHVIPGLETAGSVKVSADNLSQAEDEKRVLSTADRTVRLNIWLVGGIDGGNQWTAGKAIIDSANHVFFRNAIVGDDFADDPTQDVGLLAHELGHTLGEREGTAGTVMVSGGVQTQFIPRDMALRMHAHLDRMPP
jgi:outer membrane protein OmpA-like peptidoglycan-associated protein